MTKLQRWAVEGTQYMYDVNAKEAYTAGAKDMRKRVSELIRLTDQINSDNIKEDPKLASFLLLELADKVSTLGDENYEV